MRFHMGEKAIPFYRMRYFLPALVAVVLLAADAGCGKPETLNPDELIMRSVKLPDGQEIRAEEEITPIDMQKGMMFRDSLPRGRGMLFVHQKPGLYPYWMYQVRIPLDIIWMDTNRSIVEISPDTPPCKTRASQCPNYGGHQQAQFVLELGGGEAHRFGLHVGQTLDF
jgi:uncharacterized membrane protein (UPF0127 family)